MLHYITYFEIAAFIASLIAIPALKKKPFMLLFLVILFLVLAVEIPLTFFDLGSSEINSPIYNLQIPIIQLLYMLLIGKSFQQVAAFQLLKWAMIIFVFFTTVTVLLYNPVTKFNVLSYSAGTLILVISMLYKFYEMLRSPKNSNFLRDQFFYMLFAYFIFSLGSFPMLAMANWLYYTAGMKDLVLILGYVMSILNYLLYTTYTVCFVWMRVTKVYY